MKKVNAMYECMSGWENYITNKPVDIMLDDAMEAELKVMEKNA